jgi:hypothetical protein
LFFDIAIKRSIAFTKKHNVSLNSADGKKIILSFFIKELSEGIQNVSNFFPKVIFISTKSAKPRFKTFLTKHITKLLEKAPFYYCGIHEADSPELEMAAANRLQYQKNNSKQFIKTAIRLKVKNAEDMNFNKAFK